MKHPELVYGFLAVIGFVILALVLVSAYLDSLDAISILEPMYFSQSGEGLWLLVLFGGIFFFTVGTVGIGRLCFKDFFTALALILVPLLTFGIVFGAYMFLIPIGPMFPLRSEITQIRLVGADPLVLSLGVKAITCRDSRISGAVILNKYDQLVAQCYPERKWIEYGNFQGMGWAVLPAHSEIALTLDFNTTLSSGNYTVRLSEWEENHGSAHFTIP